MYAHTNSQVHSSTCDQHIQSVEHTASTTLHLTAKETHHIGIILEVEQHYMRGWGSRGMPWTRGSTAHHELTQQWVHHPTQLGWLSSPTTTSQHELHYNIHPSIHLYFYTRANSTLKHILDTHTHTPVPIHTMCTVCVIII